MAHLILRSALAILMLSSLASAAQSAQCRSAGCIISSVKAATGGGAWDKVEGTYEEGVHGTTPYKTWVDVRADPGWRIETIETWEA